ncbi:hypothetical protein ACR79R_20210 [Sphingobacterium spiritivorum]|uniref:hypothetical protein n=1 Tax=Sphingobacterium spiritivorum TaxID=258 RepID=UPI003DA4BEC8
MKKTIKTHRGDLRITQQNKGLFTDINVLNGDLVIYEGVEVELRNLTEVSGSIYVCENATLTAPALTEVSGSIDVYENATLTAPALTEVSGSIYVRQNAKLNIPQTKGLNYISVDRTLFVIEKEKTSRGVKIYTGYVITSIAEGKANKQNCFVGSKDDFFAHGETFKKAICDLNFKIVSEKLKNDPIKADTLFTVEKYRIITGACDLGCREFMNRFQIPYTVENDQTVEAEPMRADKLLPFLRKSNAYGIEKFESLIDF